MDARAPMVQRGQNSSKEVLLDFCARKCAGVQGEYERTGSSELMAHWNSTAKKLM
jgi:hypothetical protein